MDRKIVLTTLAAALFAFIGIWLLLSAFPSQQSQLRLYPWDVERDAEGQTRVFDLTLGRSTLADLRDLLGEEGKLSLFANPDGRYAVEAYFDDIILSNIRADWVVGLAVPQDQLQAMFDRGLRVSTLSSGARKVKLDPADAERLTAAPIETISYLPWKSLEPQDIRGNFGDPVEQITEPGGVVHWLYPELGMDIARDPGGGVVIQFLSASDFERALEPLRKAQPGS
jgi:hypothetical protein